MVEAASEHGYADATVSRVVALAGVSRATFYEHFSDRDDCFRATYREKLEVVRTVIGAAAAATSAEERPEAIVEALLGELAACPAVARLILVEALGAPKAIRADHEELIGRVDDEIAGFLDAQPPTGALQIPATALLGGVGELLATRLLAGPAQPLTQLGSQLNRGVESYRLPRGVSPHRQSHRRQRILDAAVRLAALEGYSSLTVAGIAAAAKVPRSAFYSHFDGKEEALLAAQTEGMQGAMAAAAAEYSPPAPWPARVWRALAAFFTYVAEHPYLARLDFVESYPAGQAMTRRRQQNRAAFALFLEEGYRQNATAAGLPRICSEAIFGLMRKLIVEERTERMLSILPAAAYAILAPFLGPREAAALSERPVPG